MQKYRLEKKSIGEILRGLEKSFNVFPVVTRDCVRALNILIYNLQSTKVSPEAYKQIVFLILRGFTSSDLYLKNYIYTVLIELGRFTRDGILAINCIVKDLDSRKCPHKMKNTALRALFSNLPASMHYDFEKYVTSGLIAGEDNSVVVAIKYFQEAKVPSRVLGDIQDFHQAFFNRLPVNKYSGMIEVERIAKESFEQLSSFLFISADVLVFIEAAKCLAKLQPERAAPFVEKAVHVLAALLKKTGAESFAAIKILGDLSMAFPTKVAKANAELENLVYSSRRCVSMIAILTLLKTGTSETVTKLAVRLEP
ncbi:coatomer subunit gamma, partial [Pancytospora epiphaga]